MLDRIVESVFIRTGFIPRFPHPGDFEGQDAENLGDTAADFVEAATVEGKGLAESGKRTVSIRSRLESTKVPKNVSSLFLVMTGFLVMK